MTHPVSIDDKLQILRDVARDYMNRDGLRQQRVLDLIEELDEQIVREVKDAAETAPTVVAEAEPLRAIHTALHTQDNRITAAPMFAVQERKRVYGIDSEYGPKIVWVGDEGHEADAEEAAKFEAAYDSDGETHQGEYRRVGYHEYWEFVTACFTEQGCKDYLARNGHNLGETRIYAYGTYRNAEWSTIRDFLMSDRFTTPAAPAQSAVRDERANCFAMDGKTPTYAVYGVGVMVKASDFNALWTARAASPQATVAPMNGIPATHRHGEGAIARCFYCGRYSLDPKTLSDRQPKCECGEKHGWSGSFKKPGQDAKWSGAAPEPTQASTDASAQKIVAWENPSTHAVLRDESPDMCDLRRREWRPLVYARP